MIWNAVLLSLLPISELRGGIPFAVYSGYSVYIAFVVCVLANLLVIPVVFFFLDHLHELFMKIGFYKKLFKMIVGNVRKKSGGIIKKHGYIGLLLLVAVPLPITGAYTGTLAAWLFNMRGKKAYISLMLGIVIAGVIVSLVTATGAEAFRIFIRG